MQEWGVHIVNQAYRHGTLGLRTGQGETMG
jgi:hypothetical protein